MSRSSHQRQQQQLLAQQQQQMADNDAAAAAAEMFDMFCLATTMRQVLGLHRNMCDTVGLRPAPLNEFYPKLKAKIRSWKAQALWKKFDARASHRAYSKGNACTGTRVLVIGAGPCGLRTAIEAQLLGAKVVVLEKRDRISRNNVLHLWPFVITDLRNLGAKKFYGKFCAGSIDHISIRQLQCILLKVALLLGVEIHEGVSFERTIEPSEGCGWRAEISPADHAVSHYEFDVLIGADGKRNTLEAFKRKEFRGKLAIAITANFINKKTEAEAKAEEISGVAFIFNQTFFKELYHTTGIDLENIVYYKDETHYFVMTAKKHSLIDKGVILQDFADPAELLAPANVNTEKLLDYAREAAEFSTKYQMPNLEFAVNHYGKPDVAMFDFTSMFAAESSCRVIVRKNYRLMQCLVGDSLLEPFWPTGSGCARGFLSSMDAAYAIKLWNNPRNSILGVLAQRESIYRLLAQTTPENLQRDIGSYTVDPATRYPNLNRTSVNVWQVKHLIDCDDKAILEQTFMDTNALQASQAETPVRRKRRTGDTLPLSAVLLRWIKAQLHAYEFTQNLNEVSDCFTNGKVLCALINRYRPDLVDFNSVKELPAAESNDLAFKILDKELKISRVMTGKDSIELDKIDSKIWLNYLEQICEVFRGEIPHVKHPKLDVSELREKNRNNAPDFSRLLQLSSRKAKSPMQDVADVPHVVQRRSVLDEEKVKRQRKHEPGQAQTDTPRRAKKRRSAEKTTNIEERQQRLKEIEANRQDRQSKRRMQRFQQTQNFYKSLHMLQVNTLLRESDESSPFEDYSIYMYRQQAPVFNDRVKELERKLLYPDRERGISSALPRGVDEQFSDRIKSMEQRITSRNAYGTDKKPKDLLRAIGKIDSSDWNVREIEKKIEQSKKTETGIKGREKVPKWSKEQFVARQSKMSKPVRQDSGEEKFKEIDQTLKNLDKQLKEGSVLEVGERGKNKVASIAGQFVKKDDTSEEKVPPPLAKSNSKVALAFKKQAASEKCHFCKQTVYLMEKISTEGLILHRSCLKCHHCHTNLRLGGYAFDRDDPDGRFYCTQHFRLPAKAIRPVVRKPGQRKSTAHGSHAANGSDPKTPAKRGIAESVVQLDLLDRGQTPERIEFENTDAMSDGEPSEEHIIDENEWSGRNFLQPSGDSESDLSSSSDESEDDSESDIFEEANGSPIAQQTLQLATDWIGKQHYSNVNSDDSDDDFYDSSEGLIDDGKDDTEGEDFKKAREMRREEVRLQPLPTNLPTDTETEKQTQVLGSQEDVTTQKIDDVSSEMLNRDADEISLKSHASGQTRPPSKTDIEKIEQSSDRRFSADVDAISEKLYRLNNLMKLNKDIEKVAKDNIVTSDIMKKLSLKEKWLMDNSPVTKVPNAVFNAEKKEEKVDKKPEIAKEEEKREYDDEKEATKLTENMPNGDDDRGDGLLIKSLEDPNSNGSLSKPTPIPSQVEPKDSVQKENVEITKAMPNNEETETVSNKPTEPELSKEEQKENVPKMTTDRMEIEGILDIVKMLDISFIEQSKLPLPKPETSPKSKTKDVGKILYEAEHKNDNRLGDALRQIEVKNFAGTMDTIKSQIVAPTISHQGSMDISKYFPNAKQEKQSSAALNKNQKTLKDVDLTKYFPQSPVAQRKVSVTTVADRLKRSQTEKDIAPAAEAPKAPPRRQKSMLSSTDKSFSMHEHLLDGAIDIQKATVVKPVAKKGGIKIVKKVVPKGTKAKKSAAGASRKPQDDADKILDEILQNGQEVRSPSLEYQKLFTDEKSPSEDISERIEKILEETGIELGLPPKSKKLVKTKSLGEEEFKRTQEKALSKEDGDRPSGVQKILQRFESMSSIKSDESFKLKKTSLSSTSSSLNKSGENLRSRESLKSNSDSMNDLEKTMEYLKSEWRTEATNFLQKKRDSFYSNLSAKKAEVEAEAAIERKTRPEPQWKQTKYSKFFGVKEKSPEKRKSPTKLISKRKSPAKILKKSPREEIMKHRQKVESVSSRRASFEKKIKGEDVKSKEETIAKASSSRKTSLENQEKPLNGLMESEVNVNSAAAIQNDDDKNVVKDSTKPPSNGISQIPISQNRRDSQKSVELNKNLLDTAQKVLSRRGSASSGLADVLKPAVVKAIRGPQELTSKNEATINDVTPLSRKSSQTEDALKAVLDLVRKASQTSLNDKDGKETIQSLQSNEETKAEHSLKNTPNQSRRESPAKTEIPLSRRGSQNEEKLHQSKIPSRKGSPNEKKHNDVLPAETAQKVESRKVSQTSIGEEIVNDIQMNSPAGEARIKTPQEGAESDVINSQTDTNHSRKESQSSPIETSPKYPSRRGSKAEVTNTSPQSLSRRESAAPSVLSRRSSNLSEALDQALTIDDITNADDIFNEIINELEGRKSVEDLLQPATPQEVELVAVSADSVEETENEFQQIVKHSRSPSVRKASKASSEDSIEKLFSQFTDDMLVDVEFDSNDEVVAITPRAVVVNEDENNEEDEKQITVEEAKLKFEPVFPRQVKNFSKSSSSSMSISPVRYNSKAKQIAKTLNPADMAPSVQDMLQKIIPMEDKEPDNRLPLAFPRYIYRFEEELPKPSSIRTPDSSVNANETEEQPKTVEHLEVVYELAWPARRRSRSPIPESARPPIKPTRQGSEKPLSRRGSMEFNLPIESIDLSVVSPATTSRRGSILSIKENVPLKIALNDESTLMPLETSSPPVASRSRTASITSVNIERASPAMLPTPRRGSRASIDMESMSQPSSRRGSKASIKEDEISSISPVLLPTSRRSSGISTKVESPTKETEISRNDESNILVKAPSSQKELNLTKESFIQGESVSETLPEDINIRRQPPVLTPRRRSKSSNEMEADVPKILDATPPLNVEQSSQRVSALRESAQRESLSPTPRKQPNAEKTPKETSSLPQVTEIANSDVINKQESEQVNVEASSSPYSQSVKSSNTKTLEPSREYRDLLRSRLESPVVERQSRNPSRSKEKSLEWDMEQLPRSPMPRRKYVDVLLHTTDKENSPKPIPQPTPAVVQDIPLPTKRLEEWEIIEQLERERRLALIKRDENYSHQIQGTASHSTIPIPPLNRLESLDEPQSSKLIEYIKQQTLADSNKQRDDSPKPPSRLRSPQLASKVSNENLEKQIETTLKPHKMDSPKLVPRRQHLKKTDSTEATYEDFARFTRKSADKDTEPQDLDYSETASVASNHRISNYRPKSQETASGTCSPTSSLSKSVEHLAPSRPNRHKPTTATFIPEDKVDRETKYLMDRSKHLRNMKRDFMEEKIAGNNPYLKRVIKAQKVSRDSDDDEDEVDYSLESYRPKNHTTPRFPTSSAISSSRSRREPRYTDFSIPTDYTRRPYTSHFTTPSTTSSAGSRHFVDYFKRSPPHYKSRESSKDSCVQSDSETSSAGDVELNSATEISTDSEFDHDEIIREAPKIFIDDTHLRKPTKVQIKQTVIAPNAGQQKYHINNRMSHSQQPAKREPQFKPLVQVDQSLLKSNRLPLQNPRPGDYLLNKTASTEGIASKKSLELKKRYLLGEQGNGNKIQKSGSTSILDSKIRSFHSNISECQKLLNPGCDMSSSMKTFLDRTKLGENQTEVKAVSDKKIEITIKTTAADEKENVFVNSKNELNKGMEYSETVNTTLVETLSKNKSSPIIETIDLISPEKAVPIIDLTQVDIPPKMLESNMEFIKNLRFGSEDGNSRENCLLPDNKIIDLTLESPVKSDKTVIEEVVEKPDVSKDIKEAIPDIITHIEEVKLEKKSLLDHESEKKDSPEKTEFDIQETSIQVPNIPWTTKTCILESDSLSSSSSSSVEDIQHFILDSTTSPDTQTGQIVPRLEVHDSSGTLMQIDSLMIIDGKYIGDPEDLKDMEIPPGIIIPDVPTQSPSPEEPLTELRKQETPPPSPPQKPELKFDTKNENKIDTLKNIPLILEKTEDQNKVIKPLSLNIAETDKRPDEDFDKTPTAEVITRGSDSDAEITNQALTETELSDWTADDAISENFIDLEFVLNSNKGTIKRNKKSKKKAPLQSALSITQEPKSDPEPEPCGILKNLDIEEIEFMDTGSEGSCAEAYSATNTALLRNRGYAEYTGGSPRNLSHNQQRLPMEHELKTPVNESPTLPSTALLPPQKSQSPQLTPPKQSSPSQTQHTQSYSQSLTDSTNDIDEDSLCILTNSQGATANNTATITTTTTTEESEALTVVTSPMDSSSPKTQENFQLTGSSSDPNGKTTSPSSNTTTATPATSSSSKGTARKSSHEDLLSNGNTKRKESEEMSYEEYVRKLQQKITQISNARDSIDVRKQNRRKSSKGEGSEANSVIEGNAKGLSVFEGGFSATVQPKVTLSAISVSASPSQDVHKVPEIPTLSRKLEELTKERTKQKDLIHDLVMDKLQSKKQLNAEKRLNRSRNRSMFGNNLTGSSLSPTPKMTSTNTSPYHIASSSGGDHSGSSCKENNPLVGLKTKMSPKDNKDVVQLFADAAPRSAKQRPFSENFDPLVIDDQMCKLSKTQSFTYTGQHNFPFKCDANGSHNQILKSSVYATPIPSARMSRKDEAIASAAAAEKLRTEARARARLKSNHDLGLSPEEKLQLLRKRYHLDMQEATGEAQQKSEEMRARDRKMIASKSVNDIATVQLMSLQPDENSNTTTVRSDLVADFTSDPNLSQVNKVTSVPGAGKVNRRQKDPERRKSIIQTFSSFFQKSKKDKDAGLASGTERSATSSTATTNTGSCDGMFSRFRISPKSKEKSKDKDNGSSPTSPAASTPQHQHRHPYDQRSNSQDCIAKQKYQMSLYASSPQLFKNTDEQIPPPIPPLPLNYQRSDDESYATESREQRKQRAISKATRQAELKRLRIAQEIQREQEEIEVQLKDLEARGVLIEKALRGEGQTIDNLEASNMGATDEKLLKELLEIWRNITQLKKRDEELDIRQQELQLEHRHAQLKEELNIRLSGSKLEKSSADVAAEGAILNEMLEIVAKRAALRPTTTVTSPIMTSGTVGSAAVADVANDGIKFTGRQSSQIDESDI